MAPMTNAERQKKYRQKLKQNSEKYEEVKKKHRDYMKFKRKPIAEVSENEKQLRRRQWKTANEVRKRKKHSCDEKKEVEQEKIEVNKAGYIRLLKKVQILQKKTEKLNKTISTLRQRCYRQNKKIKKFKTTANTDTSVVELDKLTIEPDMSGAEPDNPTTAPHKSTEFNKLDVESDFHSSNLMSTLPFTPMTSANIFVEDNIPVVATPVKEKVKKKIFELNVLNKSLEEVYKTVKDNSTRNILKKVATNNLVAEYKLKSTIGKSLGLKGRIRKIPKKVFQSKELHEIKNFFIRDDNSRMTAGKKECVGRGTNKKQKRLLLASMKKLHTKYMSEGGKASYSKFRRYKPCFVVRPKLADRNTCACIKHSNLLYKSQKLKKMNIITTCDLEKILKSAVCSTKSYKCMYSLCENCKKKKPPINTANTAEEDECSWIHWTRKEHKYEKQDANGVMRMVSTKKYIKEVTNGTLSKLIELFLSELQAFRKHFYNIQHQYLKYREAIDDIQNNEACILIDFSENYVCKMSEEIQSLHFGASKCQITIHTGMLYLKNRKQSFSSISPCNDHDPGAIWAHLEPVFEYINKEHPRIDTIHLFSDGPSTQYKQKKNFYQICHLLENHRMTLGTWSFFEAAHGKGAADGVGGALKRLLDQHVAFGNDISSAADAINILKENSSVKIFYVTEANIKEKQRLIPDNLIPVPRTMDIHQIIIQKNILRYRDVSCFCGTIRGICDCYNAKVHNLQRNDYDSLSKRKNCNVKKSSDQNSNPNKRTKPRESIKIIKPKKQKPTPRKSSVSKDSTTTTCSDITYAESDASSYKNEKLNTDDDNDSVTWNDINVTWNDINVPSTSRMIPSIYQSDYITPRKTNAQAYEVQVYNSPSENIIEHAVKKVPSIRIPAGSSLSGLDLETKPKIIKASAPVVLHSATTSSVCTLQLAKEKTLIIPCLARNSSSSSGSKNKESFSKASTPVLTSTSSSSETVKVSNNFHPIDCNSSSSAAKTTRTSLKATSLADHPHAGILSSNNIAQTETLTPKIQILSNKIFDIKDYLRNKLSPNKTNYLNSEDEENTIHKYYAESWAVVYYTMGDKVCNSIGQIIDCLPNGSYKIAFLRRLTRNVFTWNNLDECEEVLESHIIHILPDSSVFENAEGNIIIHNLPKLKYI